MKKTALLMCLLIALATMGGCNGSGSDISDSSAEPDSRETEWTSENAAYVPESAESAEMSGAPENEYISDNPDWLVPKKFDKKVTFDLSGGVSRNKIKEEIGYDIGFDVTTLDAYDAAVQAKWLSSEEDDFDSLRERNYINEVSPIFFPLGIAEGDWIAVENYNMTEIIGCFVTRNYFLTRMFLIKDGEIIREFESLSLGDNFVNNVV